MNHKGVRDIGREGGGIRVIKGGREKERERLVRQGCREVWKM